MSHRVSEPGSSPPKKAPQYTTFQRFQQSALPRAGVTKQFQLDPWLRCLCGSQLLDVAAFVVVLGEQLERKLKEAINGHESRFTNAVIRDHMI